MERREFVKGCVAGAAALGAAGRAAAGRAERYPRVALAEAGGAPLRAAALAPHEAYVFFYPFVSTPCLLLDLGAEVPPASGDAWPGGVGPRRSVVAYTAVCPHEWSHPDRDFSPIHYVAPGERDVLVGDRDRLIVCCAHSSAFDPAAGGRVVQSPARLPLASVVLEWDEAMDGIHAAGLRGPESFERFFAAFDRERRVVTEAPRVLRLRDYSKAVARC